MVMCSWQSACKQVLRDFHWRHKEDSCNTYLSLSFECVQTKLKVMSVSFQVQCEYLYSQRHTYMPSEVYYSTIAWFRALFTSLDTPSGKKPGFGRIELFWLFFFKCLVAMQYYNCNMCLRKWTCISSFPFFAWLWEWKHPLGKSEQGTAGRWMNERKWCDGGYNGNLFGSGILIIIYCLHG